LYEPCEITDNSQRSASTIIVSNKMNEDVRVVENQSISSYDALYVVERPITDDLDTLLQVESDSNSQSQTLEFIKVPTGNFINEESRAVESLNRKSKKQKKQLLS